MLLSFGKRLGLKEEIQTNESYSSGYSSEEMEERRYDWLTLALEAEENKDEMEQKKSRVMR